MALATLSIDLVANLARFEEGMDKSARIAEQQAARIDKVFSGLSKTIAGLGIAAFVSSQISSAKAAIDTLDKLDDLSEKFGIAAKDLSAYSYASEVAGTSTEALVTGLSKLGKNMAAAAGGSKQQAAAFAAVGVAVTDVNGKLRSADDVLLDLADKFSGYEDSTAKAALAQQIFGKTGADLLPLLNKGRAGISDLRSEAEKLGAVYGNDVAKAAGDFNDNLKRLELASEAAKVSLVSGLLPALVSITNQLIEGRKAYGSFLSATLDIGLNVNPLKSLDENLTATVGQIRKARDDLAEMEARSKSSSLIDQFNSIGSERNMQKLRDQIALLEKRETFLRSQQAGQGNLGRGNINPGDTPKIAAPILDRTKDVKAPIDRAAKLYDELIAKITEKTTASQAELDTGEKLTASQQFALDVVTKLAGHEIKLTDAQKSGVATLLEKYLVTAKAAEAQQESMKAIQAEARQLASVTESRQLSNKALQDGIDEIGLTRDQLEVLTQQRLAERIALEDQRIATVQLFDANAANLDQMKLNADALRQELALRQQAAQKQAQLRQDPAAGAKQALDEYLERVKDVGTSTKDLVSNQLSGLEDNLANFFVTGKADWKSYFQSIAIEAAKINIVRPLLAQLSQVESAAGSGGGLGVSPRSRRSRHPLVTSP